MSNTDSGGDLGWAIVELMGRTVVAGYVSDQVVGGAPMLRVDVPAIDDQPAFTKFYNASSAVYGITPTDKDTALAAAASLRARPVTPYVLPATKMIASHYEEDFDDSDDDF